MEDVKVDVLRVFTDKHGEHGNPLGVIDGRAVTVVHRQRIAGELGYSETVFIDDHQAGRLQIYTPVVELPFAGHPTVGTAWRLFEQGHPVRSLQVPAGEVRVTRDGEITRVRARADWTPEFEFHQLDDSAAVEAADPSDFGEGLHYVWSWIDENTGGVRSRMFAPAMGIAEDEATGAAAIRITSLHRRNLEVVQGRGSLLTTTWEGDGWATVGGRVVHDSSLTRTRAHWRLPAP